MIELMSFASIVLFHSVLAQLPALRRFSSAGVHSPLNRLGPFGTAPVPPSRASSCVTLNANVSLLAHVSLLLPPHSSDAMGSAPPGM